ncbi:amidase-4 [Coleophoma crateriformis]|uniref:Amidase-4 n=1 Tax=Coleophoma crateriformis TaxID=565419 RepID=A0A3D8S3M9_9HELO|nr:amidase-4 [Coleophoma crateriformis]
MSVFSLDYRADNPVTVEQVDDLAASLGVKITDAQEKEDLHRLLAVYHESTEQLMALEDYNPPVDLTRFPRENVHFPDPKDNQLGAWAWKTTIKDSQPNNGPLVGKTIAVKDCIAIAGVPFLIGTNMFKDYVPDVDATLITRLLESGGTVTGRAVCENMCHSATSHSAATGVVHNPYARGYSTGGSSSGCGALVANGDVDMAVGADQGGSIRVPAGWCGIYGLKPTFGLIPWTGCASNEPTNDHVGPMTRTVLDNALMLKAMAGTDGIDDRSFGSPLPSEIPDYYQVLTSLPEPKSLAGKKIGIITESLNMPGMDPRVRALFLESAEKFKALGATVEEVSIPMHKYGAAIWTGISKCGGYLTKMGMNTGRRGYTLNDLNKKVWPMTQEKWDNTYASTKNIFLNGAYAQKAFPGLLGKAGNLSLKLKLDYNQALEKYDVLILPNLPYIANSHCGPDATSLELIAKQVGLTSNTAPFNQSGHPVLAMPIGMLEIEEGPLKGTGTKLPVSMQVVGKWFGETEVYAAAYAWSLAYDWKKL